MRYLLLALALAATAGACATGPPGRDPRNEAPTLLVINDQATPIAVYVDGRKVGTAEPMTETCIPLRSIGFGARTITIRPLAGEAWDLPQELLWQREGWVVRLSYTLNWDRLSLQPTKRCKPRSKASPRGEEIYSGGLT